MKLNCVSQKLQIIDLEILGEYPEKKNHFFITTGKEYVVFGLSFYSNRYGKGCFVQILSDHNHLIDVPIKLFKITDNRSSRYWNIKINENGDMFLWPASFFEEFYHDDLSEGIDHIVKDFDLVKDKILTEFD